MVANKSLDEIRQTSRRLVEESQRLRAIARRLREEMIVRRELLSTVLIIAKATRERSRTAREGTTENSLPL